MLLVWSRKAVAIEHSTLISKASYTNLLKPEFGVLPRFHSYPGNQEPMDSKHVQTLTSSMWSNYRPPGHMWPSDRIFMSRELSHY